MKIKLLLLVFVILSGSISIFADGVNKKKKKKLVRKTSSTKKKTVRPKKGYTAVVNKHPKIMIQSVGYDKFVISDKESVPVSLRCSSGEIVITTENSLSPFVADAARSEQIRKEQGSAEIVQATLTDSERRELSLMAYLANMDKNFAMTPGAIMVHNPQATDKTVSDLLLELQKRFGDTHQVNVTLPHACLSLIRTPLIDFSNGGTEPVAQARQ